MKSKAEQNRVGYVEETQLKMVSQTIFSELHRGYDRVVLYFTFFHDKKWKCSMLRKVKLGSQKRVLDIGIGTGILEEILTGYSTESIVGIDMSSQMLKTCIDKRLKNVEELIQADAENLPFRKCTFDLVLSCYVIKYCKQAKFASQISVVLKPKGKLAIYDFAKPTRLNLYYVYLTAILPLLSYIAAITARWLSATLKKLPSVVMSSDWELSILSALKAAGLNEVTTELLSSGGARLVVATKDCQDQLLHPEG